MINNGCLLTNGDMNIHGLSLIYIFESCSEILTSIAYWYLALKYWTASLTFISSLEAADTASEDKSKKSAGTDKSNRKKAKSSKQEAKVAKKHARLPITLRQYNCYKRTYILIVILTKLGFQVLSIISMHMKCPMLQGSQA